MHMVCQKSTPQTFVHIFAAIRQILTDFQKSTAAHSVENL